MTKSEFNKKFKIALKNETDKYFTEPYINQIVEPYIDKNGKIPPDSIAAFALIESTMLMGKILNSVLENVLEFDD